MGIISSAIDLLVGLDGAVRLRQILKRFCGLGFSGFFAGRLKMVSFLLLRHLKRGFAPKIDILRGLVFWFSALYGIFSLDFQLKGRKIMVSSFHTF